MHTKVRELDGILDKKDRNIVSHEIPVSFISVELDSEPTDVSDGICASSTSLDGRKSSEDRCSARRVSQDSGRSDICSTLKELEMPKCTSSPSMDNSFGNPFVIKAVDLYCQSMELRINKTGRVNVPFLGQSDPRA